MEVAVVDVGRWWWRGMCPGKEWVREGRGGQEKMGAGKGYEQTRMCKGGRDMGGRGR